MRLIKNGTRGLNAIELLELARLRGERMSGNPRFPNPMPSVAEYKTACDELEESILETINGGNRLAFARKHARMAVLNEMMKAWSGYVAAIAQGDTAAILSSGFEERRASHRITSLERPQKVQARSGQRPRSIVLRWSPVRGARMYQVFICSGNPADESAWQQLALTSASRYEATDLEPLTYYAFRVVAMGTTDSLRSIASQPATALSIGFKAA